MAALYNHRGAGGSGEPPAVTTLPQRDDAEEGGRHPNPITEMQRGT
jgi:hypothetical protein